MAAVLDVGAACARGQHADFLQEAVKPRSAAMMYRKSPNNLYSGEKQSRCKRRQEESSFHPVQHLCNSAGLGQVQFKCDGKGVTGPIQLF